MRVGVGRSPTPVPPPPDRDAAEFRLNRFLILTEIAREHHVALHGALRYARAVSLRNPCSEPAPPASREAARSPS